MIKWEKIDSDCFIRMEVRKCNRERKAKGNINWCNEKIIKPNITSDITFHKAQWRENIDFEPKYLSWWCKDTPEDKLL